MSLSSRIAVTTGTLMLLGSFSASALETIFMQDFEAGLGANESIVLDPNDGPSIEARFVNCSVASGLCPFSVTRVGDQVRNFDVHNRHTNPYAGGNGHSGLPGWEAQNLNKFSPGMSGQVLGHVKANYDVHEDNYYQIDNINLAANLGQISLMFDFDSWINDDGVDGFAVAINDGSGWDLLEPNAASEMQYSDIGIIGDPSLNVLTGQPTGAGQTVRGFNGWDNGSMIDMAGTAMFDIADSYAGGAISLRFAFASGGSFQQEGINIDNIKVTGVCTTGEGPNCTPPGGGNSVPAPATLALAAFGVMAIRRRRLKI